MEILRGEKIRKFFGGLAALDEMDVSIERGEILGLIGPNGSGKSTLVNVVTGLYPLSEGRLYFNGRDISKLPPHLRAEMGLARTFQIVKPFRGISLKENILIGAFFGNKKKGRGKREAYEVVEETLEFVNLHESKDRSVEQLTVEERKRADLAKVLAMRPELLFLDEVMAGLTPKEMEEFMSLIVRINEAGVTVLVIEHVMKAIMGISRRVFVLHHGKKIAEGSPDEIVRNDDVIKAYLGDKYLRMKAGRGEAG